LVLILAGPACAGLQQMQAAVQLFGTQFWLQWGYV
jgi:hypothetical protein